MNQFMVNGVRCEVSLDRDSIRWWRMTTSRSGRTKSAESDNSKLKDKTIKQIEFSQIIAVRKPPTLDKELAETSQICRKENDIPNFRKSDRRFDKIKVYYAKQSRNKSTGKLLKLTKLSIEPLHKYNYHSYHSTSNNQTTKPPNGEYEKTDKSEAFTDHPLHELAEKLANELESRRKQRPKRLLVFANPFGGKGKAVQLFKGQVRRLLDLAEIEAKLVITKYANHARETIEDPQFNVEHFDGVVCVGGDGMFSELMNGLLYRYNRDKILTAQLGNANKDQMISEMNEQRTASPVTSEVGSLSNQSNSNDSNSGKRDETPSPQPSLQRTVVSDEKRLAQLRLALGGIGQQFVSPPLPVGVIGAGSTDANSFGLIGTNDVITATLNIILGNQIKIDVCSIHSYQEDRILRFVSTFVAYGYFGDVIRESEKLRWLGPSRYDVTGVNNLIKNRTYKGMVKILVSSKDGTPLDDTERCHANCKQCHLTTSHEYNNQNAVATEVTEDQHAYPQQLVIKQANHDDLKFLERRGAFIGVNAAVTACRCPQTKKGFSPSNHLANGCADLILVRPCTRMQYIQYLLRTGWTKMSAFDLKYVEAYRCRQFEFIAENIGQSLGKGTSASLSTTASTTNSSSSSSSYSVDDGLASSLDSKQSSQLESSGSVGETYSSWNVDGELLNVQSIRVKINNQLLRVFGTGEPSIHANQ